MGKLPRLLWAALRQNRARRRPWPCTRLKGGDARSNVRSSYDGSGAGTPARMTRRRLGGGWSPHAAAAAGAAAGCCRCDCCTCACCQLCCASGGCCAPAAAAAAAVVSPASASAEPPHESVLSNCWLLPTPLSVRAAASAASSRFCALRRCMLVPACCGGAAPPPLARGRLPGRPPLPPIALDAVREAPATPSSPGCRMLGAIGIRAGVVCEVQGSCAQGRRGRESTCRRGCPDAAGARPPAGRPPPLRLLAPRRPAETAVTAFWKRHRRPGGPAGPSAAVAAWLTPERSGREPGV